MVAAYVIFRHLARVELWDSGAAILQGLSRPPSRTLAVLLYPPLDMALLATALAVAVFLVFPPAAQGFRRAWFDRIPLWVGVPFLTMSLGGVYRRVWSRARVSEYVFLAGALLGGILVAGGLSIMVEPRGLRSLLLRMIVYGGVALPLTTGLRAFPRTVQDALAWMRHRHLAGHVPRYVLVYGAGESCTLLLRAKSFLPPAEQQSWHVIGLLDDDPNLHGRVVFGYRVLGGIERVGDLIRDRHVDEIVITAELDPAVSARLLQACAEHGVRVLEWDAEPARRVSL